MNQSTFLSFYDVDAHLFYSRNGILDIDASNLLSFSNIRKLAVWITKDFKAFRGDISEGITKKNTEVIFNDKFGHPLKFLSVVLGNYYEFYLASSDGTFNNCQLIFLYYSKPIFVNIGNRRPVSIYGGYAYAAAIDSDGSIIILIPHNSITISLIRSHPEGLKFVNVACCDSTIYALDSNGHVYSMDMKDFEHNKFCPVNIQMKTITFISGTKNHCLAVSSLGIVYVIGKCNQYGGLGLGRGVKFAKEFTEIAHFRPHKIKFAFAGPSYSLYIRTDGKLFGCGSIIHSFSQKYESFIPFEIDVKNVSFCIAGDFAVFFNGPYIPPNMPNTKVKKLSKSLSSSPSKLEIKKEPSTNVLKNVGGEKNSPSNDINELLKEITKLRDENSALKKEIHSLQEKQTSFQDEFLAIKNENEDLKQQLKKQKMKISDQNINHNNPNKDTFPNFLDSTQMKDIEKLKQIGRGATSKVFEVTRNMHFALKEIDAELVQGLNENGEEEEEINIENMKRFLKESEVLNKLNHPNIIKIFGVYLGDSTHNPSILLELCPTNLKKCVKKLDQSTCVRVILEICDAMKEIHSSGFIHRDLKLENILLDNENHVKVSDFGHCTFISSDTNSFSKTQMTGTLHYMAPEILQGKTNYDEKVDVYAFGVVVYIILMKGEKPNFNLADVVNNKPIDIPKNLTDFAQKLIGACMSPFSHNRPSFNEIYEMINKNKNNLF